MSTLAAMPDGAPDAVVAVGADGTIRYVNDRTAELAGVDSIRLLGSPASGLLPGLVPAPGGSGLTLGLRRSDGSEVPVRVGLSTMTGDDGSPCLVATLASAAGTASPGATADAADAPGPSDAVDAAVAAGVEQSARAETLSRAYLTLAQMNQAIIRADGPEALYAETCRVAVETGGYLGAWVGVVGPDGTVQELTNAGPAGGLAIEANLVVDPTHPRGRAPVAICLREGRAYWSHDFLEEPGVRHYRAAAEALGIRASASLPLRRDDEEILGALTLYSDSRGYFDGTMRGLLEQVGDNLCFALSSFAAREQLEQVLQHRGELLRRLVTAQESERARIAADLHDDSVQALAAVDLRLGMLQARLGGSAPSVGEALAQVQDSLGGVVADLRDLLFDLEAPGTGQDWTEAVRDAASHVFEGQPTTWSLQAEGDIALDETAYLQTLRIVKEALVNVRKHAGARSVSILVRPREDGVEVEIADDGSGLDPAAPLRRRGHRGLDTMRDRAEVAGGWLTVQQREDRSGTAVRFWVPGVDAKGIGG